MLKSSKTITLVLIGSTLLLAGCNRDDEENNQTTAAGGRGVYISPRVGSGFGGGTSRVGTAPSARGGFGSTGVSGIGS